MEESDLGRLAAMLHVAERTRRQIPQISLNHPQMEIDDSYAIQKRWVAMKVGEGARQVGHKIGLTSRAMQRSSNIDEPDYGVLLDEMACENGHSISFDRFIVPRIEAELAFVLKAPLSGPKCSIGDVLSCTDYVVPAVEIIDARIEPVDRASGATRKVLDTIADNAASAGFVLGEQRVRPLDVDLRWIAALIYRNAMIEDSGVAAAVLDHPANGPAWLANKLHRHGDLLEQGEIILGGSFTAPVPVRIGDDFRVDYGSLGAITFKFV
jgi:2-oxo-hept-3-ene-1,7-dioate hydratase